jgi:hypothetical protein
MPARWTPGASLARFAGTYTGPFAVDVQVRDARLHALFGAENLTLLPVGPARFRLSDSPHAWVTFREKGGSVTGMELENGSAPVEEYVRRSPLAK